MLGMIPSTGMIVLSLLSAAPTAPTQLVAGQAAAQNTQAQECVSQDKVQLEKLKVLRLRFGFNEADLSQEARDTLVDVARWLKTQPTLKINVQGHADERGTEEYNIALGERRAQAISKYLESLGVPATQLRTVSYGEEHPDKDNAKGGDEEKWSANRRVQFEPTGEIVDHDTTCKQGTEQADPNAGKKKEEEPPKQQQVVQQDPNAGKNASANSSASSRRFGWIPWWLGPLVMAAAVPGVLLAIPFILSIVYLGPTAIAAQKPASCVEPVTTPDNAVSSNPLNWCGSGWSVAQHADQRNYSVIALAIGIVGAVLSAGIALALFGVGALITVLYFIPGEAQDAQNAAQVEAAQRANSGTAAEPAPAPAEQPATSPTPQ